MAGDLDRVAVDGGREQFLEHLKTKMVVRRPEEEGMAFKKYIYEIKRARCETLRSWIIRSDEAVMIKLVEKSLLDLFTDDVLQSVDRSHGKDYGHPRKQHAFEAVEEVLEDDDDTYLDEDFSENDDPYIDEDGNFLANEQIVSDIGDELALDDEEYHKALLGYREARDLMKEARVARGFYAVVVPNSSDKPTGRGKGDSWHGWKRIEGFWKAFRLSWPRQKGERQRTLRSS